MRKLPKRTGRNPDRPNVTEELQERMIKMLEGTKNPHVTVEAGNPWMRMVPRANLETYRPILGGYPLQRERQGETRPSLDNIREVVEQLGKPFLITAHHHGILFHWNGTLGDTETYAALGFGIHRIGPGRKALSSLCAEMGITVRLPSRKTRAKRLQKMGSFALYQDRTIRNRDSVSRKRWTEEAASA